jgi:phosphoribosylformylglycinamidine (FGAM) synthase-like amidotransferase family enzyme
MVFLAAQASSSANLFSALRPIYPPHFRRAEWRGNLATATELQGNEAHGGSPSAQEAQMSRSLTSTLSHVARTAVGEVKRFRLRAAENTIFRFMGVYEPNGSVLRFMGVYEPSGSVLRFMGVYEPHG